MNAGRISLFVGAVFILSACGKTMVEGGGISDAPTTVVLTVSDLAEELQLSRVTVSDSESRIKSIELWVFLSAGQTGDGSLVRYIAAGEFETTVTFVINGGVYDFYVVANQQVGSVATKTALMSKISSRVITTNDSREVTSSGFPMVGAATGYVLDGAQATHQVPVLLKRRAAKFEAPTAPAGLRIKLADASGLDDVLPGVSYDFESPNIGFELTGFAIANGIDKSWLFNAEQRGTDWEMPANGSYQLSSFEADGSYAGVYSGRVEFGPPVLYFLDPNPTVGDPPVVYAFENRPSPKTIDGVTGYDRNEVYAMIIRGTVRSTDSPAVSATRYWRVNLVRGPDSAPQNFRIEENKVYRVRISEIRSLGYATPQLAEREEGSLPLILPSGQASMAVNCQVGNWEPFEEESIL